MVYDRANLKRMLSLKYAELDVAHLVVSMLKLNLKYNLLRFCFGQPFSCSCTVRSKYRLSTWT